MRADSWPEWNQAGDAPTLSTRQHAFGIMTCALCPSCAREHPEGARLCTACGTPLTLVACATCDAINAIDAAQCHQCGAALPRHDAKAPEPSPRSEGAGRLRDSEGAVPRFRDSEGARQRLRRDEPAGRRSREAAPAITSTPIFAATAQRADPGDDFVALAQERRYVGIDGGTQALADATPIAFAERVAHALPVDFDELPTPESARPGRTVTTRARRASHHGAHIGVAVALVTLAVLGAYFAYDVPALRAIVANAFSRARLVASPASPSSASPPPEAPAAAHETLPPTPGPTGTAPQSAPAVDASNAQAHAPAPTNTGPAADAAAPGASAGAGSAAQPERAPAVPDATPSKPRPARAQERAPTRAPAQQAPSTQRAPDRDAEATRRLIERDLGPFLTK